MRDRVIQFITRSRWIGGRFATKALIVAALAATVFAGTATVVHNGVETGSLESQWLTLASARLEVLAATSTLSTELTAGVPPADAGARFEAVRSAVDARVSQTESEDPALTSAVLSLRSALSGLVVDGTETADRLHIGAIEVATQVGRLGERSVMREELRFADLIASDLYRTQLAIRLAALERFGAPDRAYSLSLAADLTQGSGGSVWSIGKEAIASNVPAPVQQRVADVTTSQDARIVRDAAVWAVSNAGLNAEGAGVESPNPATVGTAGSAIVATLSSIGTEAVELQLAELGDAQRSDRSLAFKLTLASLLALAVAGVIVAGRLARSRMNDDELRAAASTDKLTGMGNRVHLDRAAAELMADDAEIVLMHIDLDHFKPVNDTYGHAVGDRVLQLTADRLKQAAHDHGGAAARLGGDEFALVLPSVSSEVIDSLTRSILDSLKGFRIGSLDLSVGASIGVARGTGDVGDLLINADLALYEAKRTGRGQASTFRAESAAFVSLVRERLRVGDVLVSYQPQVSLRDSRCVGVEVLARLVDETGTRRPAGEWLGVAEWLGVTGELFEHVISAVVADLLTHPIDHAELWFNVAPNDLIRPGGGAWVLEQLGRLGLPMNRLGIELTETEAITDVPRLAAVLVELRENGLGVALDDFGARNTPIGHLVDLPVSRVKLDSSLIAGIGHDMPPSSWVVKAMAELATRLDIEVLAEGVSSGNQVVLLARLGVPFVQGYLIGLPGPVDRVPLGVNLRELAQSSLGAPEQAAGPAPAAPPAEHGERRTFPTP